MHISKFPSRSYWEGEWLFPKTGTEVSIALEGGEDGPKQESRQFYLALPQRFEQIMAASQPRLDAVFREWLDRPLPADIFAAVELTGFSVDNMDAKPLRWEISFETRGDTWLGITIPFIDDAATDALVDT